MTTLDHGEDDGLVEHIRDAAQHFADDEWRILQEAAARIEQDRETIRELRQALELALEYTIGAVNDSGYGGEQLDQAKRDIDRIQAALTKGNRTVGL